MRYEWRQMLTAYDTSVNNACILSQGEDWIRAPRGLGTYTRGDPKITGTDLLRMRAF
jgi:hypothetical protein